MRLTETHRKLLITVAVPVVRYLIDEYVSDDVKEEVQETVDDEDGRSYSKFVFFFAVLGVVAYLLSRRSGDEDEE